jgi:phosphoesterase RecJ-like protein
MANNQAVLQMAAALNGASRLLLVAHLSPDGDSLGSLLGLGRALMGLGKLVTVFVPDGVPQKYRFLPGADAVVVQAERLPRERCTVVLLDCGEWQRSGLPPEPFAAFPLLNIDHHRTSTGIGQYNLIDKRASATGELIYELLLALSVEIDQEVATCLYTAIVGDTGWFRFSNSTPKVHRLAARLLEAGARQELVNDQMMTMPETYLRALAVVLGRLTTFCERQGAIAWLNWNDLQQFGVTASDLEGLIDYPRSLPGVQVAALVVEIAPRTCKVSLRSRQAIDVSDLAAEFGGGGHARAAGCTIPDSELDNCVSAVRAAMERRLRHA